jgi:hypothetical protein
MRPLQTMRACVFTPALIVMPMISAVAQLANASTAATGLSGAFTARATGYNAVAWNPANLAMPGNPGFSFTLLSADGMAGLAPIGLKDFHDVQGQTGTPTFEDAWLARAAAHGGETGGMNGGITAIGMSLGSFAFQVSSKVSANANLSPDAFQAVFFGNVKSNVMDSLVLAGSTLQGAAYSTGAVSYALPLQSLIPLTNFAVGVTAKYTVGHAVLMAMDNGSSFATNETMNFAAIIPDSLNRPGCDTVPGSQTCVNRHISGNIGSGIGLDLGGAWTLPGFRFGVSVQNLVNTFKWDTTKLTARPATGLYSASANAFSGDTDRAYASAPAELRAKVAAQRFKPVFAAGVSFDWLPMMTVSADIRQQVGGGIEVGPSSLIAVGTEYRIVPFIPIRAGVSMFTGGVGISGGLGLHFLGIETGIAGYVRKRDSGTESGGTLTLFSIRP